MRALVLAALLGALAMPAAAEPRPDNALGAFDFFIGCWRGEFANTTAVYEERCMTRTLNGTYVRDVHYTRNTDYWGETLYGYDGENGTLTYIYFDASGGGSRGPVRFEDRALVFPADRYVTGDGEVMQLRTSWRPDGAERYVATSERLEADGTWSQFMRVTYTRTEELNLSR